MSRPGLGSLRRRVTIERPVLTPVEGGEQTVNWIPVAHVFAEIRAMAGREDLAADALAGTVTHRVRMRYRPGVTADMRLTWGNRHFNIRAVLDPDERKRWLVCICEEQRI